MFTSGSTGQPKGVVQTHNAISRSLKRVSRAVGLDEKTRFFQFASYSFDASIFEVFGPWSVGGCLCVPKPDDKVADISSLMRDLRVNIATLTPTIANLLSPQDLPDLKTLCIGGEAPSDTLCHRWASELDLNVLYGTTETAVWDTFGRISGKDLVAQYMGFPVQDPLWIVHPENHRHLSLPGIAGEICVQGPSIAKGYLGMPELTAERKRRRHIQIWGSWPITKGWIFCTSWVEGSSSQRLELAEVEAALKRYVPDEYKIVADMVEWGCQEQLFAFFAAGQFSASEIKISSSKDEEIKEAVKHMEEHYPRYMVPRNFLAISHIPLTRTGKIDRNLLAGLAAKKLADKEQNVSTPTHGQEASAESTQSLKEVNKIIQDHYNDSNHSKAPHLAGDCNLSSLAIDSVDAASIASKLNKGLQLDVSTTSLLKDDLKTSDILEAGRKIPSTACPNFDIDQLSSDLELWKSRIWTACNQSVLLTGATGFLGNELLHQLLLKAAIHKVFALMRGKDIHDAKQRLIGISKEGGWWDDSYTDRVEVWLGDLSQRRLGLSFCNWQKAFKTGPHLRGIDIIIHNGAVVNWASGFSTMEDSNVASTFEILKGLSLSGDPPALVYVSGGYMPPGSEDEQELLKRLSNMPGYDQTKFVCDRMIDYFNHNIVRNSRFVSAIQPGFIAGSTKNGFSQVGDTVWRLVKSCILMGTYSVLDADNWIPIAGVDQVAAITLHAGFEGVEGGSNHLNIYGGIVLKDIWDFLVQMEYNLEAIDHETSYNNLLEEMQRKGSEHPMHPLMDWVQQNKGILGDPAPDQSMFHDTCVNSHEAVHKSLSYLHEIGYFGR
ncbi:unnamed protein product, partial [Clonostachys rhizophaga]